MSEFIVTIDGKKFSVNTNHSDKVVLNGSQHSLEIFQLSEHTFNIKLDNNVYHVTSTKLENGRYSFLVDGNYYESNVRTKLEEEAANLLNNLHESEGIKRIKSPMPGLILRLNKEIGEKVTMGEPLLLLEAMKMENEIRSPSSGTVSEIMVSEGSSVEKNQILVIIT
jgi:biotin carboxyl carrier protein